jgi:hypothetical protein
VWSSRRRGQEQHEKEEGDKEAKQLENNLKKREMKRQDQHEREERDKEAKQLENNLKKRETKRKSNYKM